MVMPSLTSSQHAPDGNYRRVAEIVVLSVLTEAAASDNVWKRDEELQREFTAGKLTCWVVMVKALFPQQGQVFVLKAPDWRKKQQHFFFRQGKLVVDTLVPMRSGRIWANIHWRAGCGELIEEGCRRETNNAKSPQGKQLPFVWSGLRVSQAAADIMSPDPIWQRMRASRRAEGQGAEMPLLCWNTEGRMVAEDRVGSWERVKELR